MNSRHFIAICTASTILLMGFQCGHKRWTKHARDYIIQINPQTIKIHNDTLRFHISIDARAKELRPDETQTFEVYIKGETFSQRVVELSLPKEKVIDQDVVQVLERNNSIHSMDVRFCQYRSGRLKLVSPDLQIATIDDAR